MFDVSVIPDSEKTRIASTLLKWGISINKLDGTIEYMPNTSAPEVKAKSIYLIRHAETIAVAKHEFMSDTSHNCEFTENGINIINKQADDLDKYGFDIAFFGPIQRTVNTKNLIMSRPQKFNAVKLQKLHGINNAGWEYKTYYDLQNDPLFLAREVELNMFARTHDGSSWGTVIANCADVLEYINANCVNDSVLLISQGSILRGLQILLRAREHPWDEYTASGMYHVGDDSGKKKDYGMICRVY